MSQNLRVAELDFDTIKSNLKEFLRTKPGFTDYDFEGSGLSIMLDVLAYNTHYNAVIANMLAQEMFLDTAVKRETVSLHAKRMGYLPRSARAARAYITVEVFPQDNPPTITIGKNAAFTSSGQIPFQFVTLDSVTIQKNVDNRYIFQNIPIFEGRFNTFKYVVTGTPQQFVIPNKNVDTSLIRVSVQKSTTNTDTTIYRYFENISDISSDSQIYFLRVNESGFYEVYFGDGVLGKTIEAGNVVIIDYLVCNGEVPNGAGSFKFSDLIQGYSSFTISTTNKAFGGGQPESIQSIKENAYKRMLSQNRAVSESDFKSIINSIIPIGDAAVWGGENNSPPIYGKVFISLIPLDINAVFDDETKQLIANQLRSKMTVTVIPEIVDPDKLFIDVSSTVYYDQDRTANNAQQMRTIVYSAINSFISENLNKFNAQLKHSQLVALIDDSDKSVVSNITTIGFTKVIDLSLNSYTKYIIDFKNPIKQSSDISQKISTTGFYVDGYESVMYMDDLGGKLRLYSIDGGVKTVIKDIGTVDYSKGIITIDYMNVTSFIGSELKIKASPLSNNVIGANNTVLVVNASDVVVNTLPEPRNKNNYVFTPSA
jgi:hypothetical protein